MATPQASSRLELLQARFQQKQLQEKEQKLLQLYDQQQQRAYQVVQRGSAGSNSSNHTTYQHTVTKTSNSSHTTSTSQGGKVRQMFDERRHTTVKGIDRSYPLEPLENKPRKQTNGNASQKNGNLTVNRHSVTVKRVARADVNSNLNGGKPVVSYHEEIARESFGPSVQGHTDDDEFGNENHVAQYANGNHRDETRIEEVLDDDTIERNRMMAKLHLMQYDETLKHRVKNDLESEEFPEDFMVDVPDKLPKQSVTKKLSQAEARLERFRNANAKRSNSITKNTSTTGVPRKRFDPIFPAKSTSSGIKDVKSRTKCPRSSGTRDATSRSAEETLSSSESERTAKRKSESRFFCRESKRSATTYDSETSERLSPDFLKDTRPRSESPKYFCKESGKSATTYAMDSKARSSEASKGRHRRSEEPKFFCKESATSATTYAIDSGTSDRLSPDFSKDRSESPKYFCKEFEKSATTYAMDSKARSSEASKGRHRRSEEPKFFCKESATSATTYAIDSGTSERLSPDFLKDTRPRSESPKYFCKEPGKSATTYAMDSKARSSEASKGRHGRSEEPKFFCKESATSATTYAIDSRAFGKLSPKFSKDIKRTVEPKRSKDWSTEFKGRSTKSAHVSVDTVDRDYTSPMPERLGRSSSPGSLQSNLLRKPETRDGTKQVANESCNVFERLTSRNTSPRYPYRESGSTMRINRRGSNPISKSPEFPEKIAKKRSMSDDSKVLFRKHDRSSARSSSRTPSTSPHFFSTDADRSATIMLVTPETITKVRTGSTPAKKEKSSSYSIDKFSLAPANKVAGPSRRTSKEDLDEDARYNIRSSVSRFFSEQCEKASRNVDVDARFSDRSSDLSRGSSPVSLNAMKTSSPTDRSLSSRKTETAKSSARIKDGRSGTPEFFCYETDKSATTVSLKPKATKDWTNKRSESPQLEKSGSRGAHPGARSSKSPDSITLPKDVELISSHDRRTSRDSSPRLQKVLYNRIGTPEFFCYETDKHATTVSLKPKPTIGSINQRSESPRSRPGSSQGVHDEGRSSRTRDIFTVSKDVKLTDSTSRRSNRESSPRLQKTLNNKHETPEFSCYETDKFATTASLKSRPTVDSINQRTKSPRLSSSTSVHDGDRPSKSSDSVKDIKASPRHNRSHSGDSSPRLQKIADIRCSTPEFYCYETEKSATTVSLKPKPTKNTRNEYSKRPGSGGSTGSRHNRSHSRDSSPRLQKIADIRRSTPEFYCCETEKSATTVSLKPKPSKNTRNEYSKRPGSGGSTGSRHNRSHSRDSSPRLQKIADIRRSTPEFYCYETEKSATTVSLKPKPSKNTRNEYSKRPGSGGSTGSRHNRSHSRDSSPRLQKIADIRRSTPEFYCYETEKSATTVSLKPKPSKNTRNEYSKRPGSGGSTGSQSKSRPSKSPDVFVLSKDTKATARRGSGNVLRSTKLIREIIKHQKDRNQPDRTLQSSTKDSRRSSIAPDDTTGISRVDLSVENEVDTLRVNRNVGKRSPTPPARTYDLPTPESSPKSSISAEVDAEIQEITMPDQYLERGRLQRELRSTYSRSSKETSQASMKSKAENASTYSVRKPSKKRGSLLESDIFEPTKKRQQAADHRRISESRRNADFASKGVSSKTRERKTSNSERSCSSSPSPASESLFRATKRRIGNEESRAKSWRSKDTEKSPRKQPLALGSVELVRKIIKGARSEATNEVERKQEATKRLEGETKMQETDSVVSRTVEFTKYEEESSRRSYERTDSVESALRRFDSIDAVASVRSTLEENEESVTGEGQNRSSKTPDGASRKSSRESSLILENKHKTPEFFCYETDKLATTVSLKPKPTMGSISQRSESPRPRPGSSAGIHGAGRSSKHPGSITLPKDVEVINNSNRRSSRESPPGLQKIQDRKSKSPEFFCYETDKLATTVSLKPKPTMGSISHRSESPRSRPGSSAGIHGAGRSSKHPGSITLPKDVEVINNLNRRSSRESPPGLQKIQDRKSKSPEFFCYETDKLATTVSLKPKPTIDSFNQRSESPRSRPGSSAGIHGASRSSKHPESITLPKDVEVINNLNRRSSRDSPPVLQKIQDRKSKSPEFFCYETDKLATTVSLKPKPTIDSFDQRSESPRSRPGSSAGVHGGGRSSKSPDTLTLLKDKPIGIDNSAGSSRTIFLKALNRASSPRNLENKSSRTSAKGIFNSETPRNMRVVGTQETRRQKKLAKDSFAIARVLPRSKSPACRRKLFPDGESGEETETGSSRSKGGLESTTKSSKRDATYSIGLRLKCVKPVSGDETSTKEAGKGKTKMASIGASDSDRSVSVKQLRSIEDIRKSIGNEGPGCGETGTRSRSAIANNVLKCSSTVQPRRRQSCPLNGDIRVGSKKDMSSSKRSEGLSARDDRLGESGRSVKCATRFSRVAKSPSPDSSKATETSRTRRSVPPTPSKSPDTVTRRHSTDLKAQDTKSTKRPAPVKGTEPIGNRKTTTTTTTRKSTDVVDGAILENGPHLRDQTAETKYDNDSPTTKKNDAFVIAFDEQPPKENDVSLPRKPRLRKQSTDKHTPTSQSGRPPSSVSSTSSSNTMQSHVSTPKSRMASKVHTPSSATSASRGSASSKTGGNVCSADLLTPCKMCGRRFAQDRITLHEQICVKTGQKKRKQFDTVMFRVKGTELEKFVRKGHCKKQPEKPPEVKSNWRRKHEDFINAIRSAKQVQAHLAAGGKLSDLPPPPPSDTSDYIQCPHCGRKFNKSAAERHIPKCENMLHNKPVHSRAPKLRR